MPVNKIFKAGGLTAYTYKVIDQRPLILSFNHRVLSIKKHVFGSLAGLSVVADKLLLFCV